ncbi:MAG: class I SAM-dependent methyltransferase [Verrucomicrobiales bacterium]|nr:class I SAM-dependent methyltransferase [Verrucomicrobiales bacterium]
MSSYQEKLTTDMQRLEKMLQTVVGPQDQTHTPTPDDRTRILNLACGSCNEADTLTNFFAKIKNPKQDASLKKVELLGIDVRAREIADAQRRFRSGKDCQQNIEKKYQFLTGDASKLDSHRSLDENFDVVFMRHQNYYNGGRVWEKIFEQALAKLKDDGQLVITSYFDHEHQLALNAIQRLGGQLIDSQQNLESRELPTLGKSVDRHVAVFRRKD